MISRHISLKIKQRLWKGKAILVLGPRQVGKTTLLKEIARAEKDPLYLNADDPQVRERLKGANSESLKTLVGKHTFVFVDEAQRIENIGLTLKLITDQMKHVQLVVSGSSALELANEIKEPLTGRKWEYQLYPISWGELSEYKGPLAAGSDLENRILYGMYPEVITREGEERELLQELAGSYLYKDLLSLAGIRKPELLDKLLQALALQLGSEVSFNELSGLLQVDKNTIMHYIQLLEKAFVIFRLQPLSRNLRNEIHSSRKIYFYDTGIRNAILGNFNSLASRGDKGALWENFLISERRKKMEYAGVHARYYFWRQSGGREIDYLEEYDGALHAHELKWLEGSYKFPDPFTRAYPAATRHVITKKNFEEWLTVG